MEPVRPITAYTSSCPNYGTCRILELEAAGVKMDPIGEIRRGVRRVEKFYDDNIPAFINFYCCTGCKLPFNMNEANKVNRFLGLRAADIKLDLDDDFLAALEGA